MIYSITRGRENQANMKFATYSALIGHITIECPADLDKFTVITGFD